MHWMYLKSSQFMSPFMTPVQLHLSLPLTEIHDLRLAVGCLSEISSHVVLMSLGPAHDQHDAWGLDVLKITATPIVAIPYWI